MRKEFAAWMAQAGAENARIVFLTGDLGFGALEEVKTSMQSRFINMGVCEQNMVSFAAGLAKEGLIPICYSIAPFVAFRPYEQVRLDAAIHGLPVKLVGNGGGYGYGIMGATHHALEDLAVLSCLPGFRCFIPLCGADVNLACEEFLAHPGPAYLRLGLGIWPAEAGLLPPFAPVRRHIASPRSASALTIVSCGPVTLNLFPWITARREVDVFTVSTLPLSAIDPELVSSVQQSGELLVIEEHAQFGGLAAHLAMQLACNGVHFRLHHRYAKGYPGGAYGSQAWHQQESLLDADSLRKACDELAASKTAKPNTA